MRLFEFESETKRGVFYTVCADSSNNGVRTHYSCLCPGYLYHGHCKHILLAADQDSAMSVVGNGKLQCRALAHDLDDLAANYVPKDMKSCTKFYEQLSDISKAIRAIKRSVIASTAGTSISGARLLASSKPMTMLSARFGGTS